MKEGLDHGTEFGLYKRRLGVRGGNILVPVFSCVKRLIETGGFTITF